MFALFVCNKGLGLAHKVFDKTNAMLALSGVFKFSAKSITHSTGFSFVILLYMLGFIDD